MICAVAKAALGISVSFAAILAALAAGIYVMVLWSLNLVYDLFPHMPH